jgi:subtilisin-like proprotein convertase family protein
VKSKVQVTLNQLSHTWPEDIGVLLVSPSGQTVVLMSHAIGRGTSAVKGVTLTFDDAAASPLPDGGIVASGSYRPASYQTKVYPAPAPAGPYGGALSAFNGINPNGTWSLYVVDDAPGDSGSIAGGWGLTINVSKTGLQDNLGGGRFTGALASLPAMSETSTLAVVSPNPAVSCRLGLISLLANGSVVLRLEGQAGTRYRIQASTDYIDWQDLQMVTAPAAAFEVIDQGTAQRRFYRAITVGPEPIGNW